MKIRLMPLYALALVVLACVAAVAAPQVFRVDLDGRGEVALVSLEHYKVKGPGSYGDSGEPIMLDLAQLVVRRPDGTLVWAGPRDSTGRSENPLVFGRGEFDGGDIEIVGRFGLSKEVRLIGEGVFSDVGPHLHRVFRWDGRAFRFVRWGVPIEKRAGSGHFVWSSNRMLTNAAWIDHFDAILPDGSCRVKVLSNGGARTQTLVVDEVSDGFKVRAGGR